MKITHVVPGSSAAGSLIEALRTAGRTDDVLTFRDDLSCGPIASDGPGFRQRWWQESVGGPPQDNDELHEFWMHALNLRDKIILWFSKHSAYELAFRLSWAWHMERAQYHVVDVTGLRVPFRKRDGSDTLTRPLASIGTIPSDGFLTLLGTERSVSPEENATARETWSRLMMEDAPFRVVTPHGMQSAAADYFDHQLLAEADHAWQPVDRIIHNVVGKNWEPYRQVGDLMLLLRLAALVEQGKLIADRDMRERHACVQLSN